MRDFFLAVSWIAVVVAMALSAVSAWGDLSCKNYASMTGRTTQYDLFGGCFVESESGWITKAEYGQVITVKEVINQLNSNK